LTCESVCAPKLAHRIDIFENLEHAVATAIAGAAAALAAAGPMHGLAGLKSRSRQSGSLSISAAVSRCGALQRRTKTRTSRCRDDSAHVDF